VTSSLASDIPTEGERGKSNLPFSFGFRQPFSFRQRREYYPPFYFGETLTDKLANYNATHTYADEPRGEYRRETTPVGSFPPNAFGLYDMHGNVYEWCEDDYHESYENAPTDGSAWLSDEKDTRKILRGGCWNNNLKFCRSAYRSSDLPPFWYGIIGFRVVRAAPRILF
jgi:formylglycine-generating enzyme required for sulfatase activity